MNDVSRKFKVTIASLLFMISNFVSANNFHLGETIFVSYPAANIKDDAFIVGKINKIMPNGDYKIAVLDYVEGHDYGVSCVPMVKKEGAESGGSDLNQVWDLWTDTTKLEKEKLDYVVAKKDVLELGHGKTYFIERNNLYIVFGRWKSDAPMLSAARIEQAEKQAKANGLADMIPAFELAKLQRNSFYGDYGRPLMAFETIAPLVNALQTVDKLLAEDHVLKKHWFAKNRNWKVLSKNTRMYFLVQAIDKIVEDAKNQVYEEGLENAAPKDLEQLNHYLKVLSRK